MTDIRIIKDIMWQVQKKANSCFIRIIQAKIVASGWT